MSKPQDNPSETNFEGTTNPLVLGLVAHFNSPEGAWLSEAADAMAAATENLDAESFGVGSPCTPPKKEES